VVPVAAGADSAAVAVARVEDRAAVAVQAVVVRAADHAAAVLVAMVLATVDPAGAVRAAASRIAALAATLPKTSELSLECGDLSPL
jgi:hypothetical protein